MLIVDELHKYKLFSRLIIIKLINLIEKNKLLKYRLSNKIIAIKLINLIEKTRTTNLEFLCLFKNSRLLTSFRKLIKQ